MNYNLIFLDTETTGHGEDDRLVQVCYKNQKTGNIKDNLFLPPVPISIEAMEVTHITNKMVKDKPAFVDSEMFLELDELFKDENTVLVAHNAPFDVEMLRRENLNPLKVIDTLRVAKILDPENKIGSYRLQYLRYLLELDNEISEKIMAHDAKGDVLVLEKLFDRLFQKIEKTEKLDPNQIIEKMIEDSTKPVLVARFGFGKYKGELIKDIADKDKSYLEWLYKQKTENPDSDRDLDMLYTLKTYLKVN